MSDLISLEALWLAAVEKMKQAEPEIISLPSADVPDTNVGDINCIDCIKHGGDWECDHVNCHKGKNAPNDVISRKQAIEAMGEEPMVWNDDDAFALGERNQWERDVEAIKGVPSVEPERKKGKWIDKSGGIEGAWNYCSVCMEQAIELYDFCPNCGADMRGEEDE